MSRYAIFGLLIIACGMAIVLIQDGGDRFSIEYTIHYGDGSKLVKHASYFGIALALMGVAAFAIGWGYQRPHRYRPSWRSGPVIQVVVLVITTALALVPLDVMRGWDVACNGGECFIPLVRIPPIALMFAVFAGLSILISTIRARRSRQRMQY